MKKLLAAALAVIMTCSVMTACGNDESSSDTGSSNDSSTTTTTPAATTPAETPASSEEGDSPSESEGDGSEEDVPQPRDISEAAGELKYLEGASITFDGMEEAPAYVSMFNEEKGGLTPTDEGYDGDEAILEFSIEEVSGVDMLKVNNVPKDDGTYNGSKIRFDMNQICEGQEDKLADIFTVKADLILVAKDEATNDQGESALVPGWVGGSFGTNNNGEWNGNMIEWSGNEWTSEWCYVELKITPGIYGADSTATFNSSYETNYLVLMEWGISHDIDLYIADLVFETEDGTVITVD